MAPRTRTRNIRYGGWTCGILNGTIRTQAAFIGVHSCTDETHPGPPYLTGGPFSVTKKQVFMDRTEPYTAHYGPFVPFQDWTGWLYANAYTPAPVPTRRSLAGWGAKGYNRAYPLHPIYSLGVSIGELRDFPRMIQQTWDFFKRMRLPLSRIPRTLGDFLKDVKSNSVNASNDYLNLQFGWVPFAKDLAFIAKMESKLQQKITWLRRHNKKPFRRKFDLDSTEWYEDLPRTLSPQATMSPVLPTQLYAGSVVTTYPFPVSHRYKSKIWFSSKWKIYMPELNDLSNDLSKLKAQLAGIDLDASIIYNLTPWSWLLDWFTNVGDVLQNISLMAKHQCVAVYAYVMCRETHDYDARGYVDVNVGTRQSSGVWTGGQKRLGGKATTKYTFLNREVANPYGFGITYASLSAYQMSILAALGLSRGGNKLALRA
jgi:hypothetical protein